MTDFDIVSYRLIALLVTIFDVVVSLQAYSLELYFHYELVIILQFFFT
jgi:hypothetical protein